MATIFGYSPAWISRSVISLAGQVEAISPTEIRTEILARAKSALFNYE
jgi:predicted DNA-binding transcriptional regulator YafY